MATNEEIINSLKTNWKKTDYYNYGDLNRVESATPIIRDKIKSLKNIDIALNSTITTRTNKHIEFADSLNRIESNINKLMQEVGKTDNLLDLNESTVEYGTTESLFSWSKQNSHTFAATSVDPFVEGFSAQITSTYTAGQQHMSINTGTMALAEIKDNEDFTGSVYFKSNVTLKECDLIIYWFDGNGKFIRNKIAGRFITDTTWKRASVTDTVPTGAKQVQLELKMYFVDNGDQLNWDGAQLENLAELTEFKKGGETKLPNLIEAKTDWTSNFPFSYIDANRLEGNLAIINDHIENNIDNIPYCGEIITTELRGVLH